MDQDDASTYGFSAPLRRLADPYYRRLGQWRHHRLGLGFLVHSLFRSTEAHLRRNVEAPSLANEMAIIVFGERGVYVDTAFSGCLTQWLLVAETLTRQDRW